MRYWLWRLALILGLGLLANLSLAAVLHARTFGKLGAEVGRGPVSPADRAAWRSIVPADWPDPVMRVQNRAGIAAEVQQCFFVLNEYAALSLDKEERERQILARESFWTWSYRYGWPLPALEADYWRRIKAYQRWEMETNALRIGSFDLPFRPIWSGLVVNVGVLAMALLGPLAAWRSVTRWRRQRRGWCLQCGYDLRGDRLRGCPECGWGREGGASASPRGGVAAGP